MTVLCVTIAVAYILLTAVLFYNWKKIPSFNWSAAELTPLGTKITVVVSVRNEANDIVGLLQDLELQTYPQSKFEVIIVDDHSTDDTVYKIQMFIATSQMDIKLLELTTTSGKKQGIATGIANAAGTWIATTDGDCSVGPRWLETIMRYQSQTDCKFIFSGVSFHGESNWFEHVQTIEFAALTGSGASSLQAGFPNMCNGANLAYEKKTFQKVNGFEGNFHIPSGDDEFLMHKIFRVNKSQVGFLKSPYSTVFTHAKADWKSFFHQRKRWASKWPHYQMPYVKWLAAAVLLGNLNFILWCMLCITQQTTWTILIITFMSKSILDGIFINDILTSYKKKLLWIYFLISIFIYPFYVSFFAFNSNRNVYEWKGRTLKS